MKTYVRALTLTNLDLNFFKKEQEEWYTLLFSLLPNFTLMEKMSMAVDLKRKLYHTFVPADLIQEDIVPVKNRNAAPCTRWGCKWPKYGPDVIVPYQISEKSQITAVLMDIEEKTCVKFVPREEHQDFLYIFSGSGCWSYVGRIGKQQPLSLKVYYCLNRRIIQHEILHALGFHHEHSRSDRDAFVKIQWNNIIDGKTINFSKFNTINHNISYDYNSVMQYRNTAFSKNGAPTIIANDDAKRVLGTAQSMSDIDYARVNRLYECC
uniref:Metalloendopeptidase n=1 Tax=Cynoglossus semilaevis TaxID=244447 RepID=A0A3P8VGX6_CYNSE